MMLMVASVSLFQNREKMKIGERRKWKDEMENFPFDNDNFASSKRNRPRNREFRCTSGWFWRQFS
jgi:hypothetical protein